MTPEETLRELEKRLPGIMMPAVKRELIIYCETDIFPSFRKAVSEAQDRADSCRRELEQLKTLLIEFMARERK